VPVRRDTVRVLVGQAEQKSWWRNLRTESEIDLWPAGDRLRGCGRPG
jgi:hypothetical protein